MRAMIITSLPHRAHLHWLRLGRVFQAGGRLRASLYSGEYTMVSTAWCRLGKVGITGHMQMCWKGSSCTGKEMLGVCMRDWLCDNQELHKEGPDSLALTGSSAQASYLLSASGFSYWLRMRCTEL